MSDSTKKLVYISLSAIAILILFAVWLNLISPTKLLLSIVGLFSLVPVVLTSKIPESMKLEIPRVRKKPSRGGKKLLLLGLLGSSIHCATPGGQAFTVTFKTCEVGAVPSELQGLEQTAIDLLLHRADNNQLKSIGINEGITLGLSTVNCLVSAAIASLQARLAPKAEADPQIIAAIRRGQEFLAENGR